ncbi:threonine/homoserine exporter RhtA [Pseudomonas sp. RIT-PI-S]|uniref:threonine/homoserine exporter RhtA n=1 Tax=Pseudomonas sp. RIT-PI-S TaxID=3035295 RepID=UPI0021DB3CB3|nr:threonine/homoserine exporter RhtA [Pseudomonas sp. RIT-PI-S]
MASPAFLRSSLFPIGLLVIAMASIQSGASLAKSLFPLIGAPGTTAIRLVFASFILLVVLRPWQARMSSKAWRHVAVYGMALGGMNFLFYMSLRTVPIGIAVALEFTGPLAVAVLSSRRKVDFCWVGLAVAGLLLLVPGATSAGAVDPTGGLFALGAGACWALYILFGQKAGEANGIQTAGIGVAIAAACIAPFGVASAGSALLNPAILPAAIGVAILSTALPYSLEMVALTRIPARTFGILMSMEPAIGALSGLLFLGELLTLNQWLAIAAIIAASAGATLTMPRQPAAPVAAD